MKGFIVAGTNSGCGKTTVTMGLMALLKRKGLSVSPFKTGPDFIDPMFHETVLGMPSYNLDSYLLAEDSVRHLFQKHTQNKDVAVVEGVMGLFDGLGPEGLGSTAQLAEMLDLPVILVVNCKALYQSVAAIISGFKTFSSKIKIGGVILNHVAAGEHYSFLKKYIQEKTGVPCIGHLPFNKQLAVESRHLGLLQAEEVENLRQKVDSLVDVFEKTVDVELLLNLAGSGNSVSEPQTFSQSLPDLSKLHLGVAYDKAFRFYYRDNLELLEECGASLYYFSPLQDSALPEEINALYLGGGYPEVFAQKLSENKTMREDIRSRAESGLSIFAECGGLMYLTESIITSQGEFPMTGVFNCKTRMTERLQRFGYAEVMLNGVTTRCHEFHHSVLESPEKPNYQFQYQLSKPFKERRWECGLSRKNILAGYAHLHFYSDVEFFNQIINLWKRAII
ncbi:MAG: cobyrinate a,c-diamide synthase [Bacteroidota bacterium]|nr:cobyrinate a,c-diamide synthase [Bacteroidota bacterium]